MESVFVCPRCGNSNPVFLGKKNGATYCRRCIGFPNETVEDVPGKPHNVRLNLAYSLSAAQKDISEKVISNFKEGIDTLVYAVCGSGKTEISYGVIAYAMSKGMHVGFALPRRDVVIELYFRLKDAFPDQRVVSVYGQHTSSLTGDCIILTTHQLYRYPNYFDLLVLDEIDAFPFKGDRTLNAFFKSSLRGHCVMMTATPSKAVIREFQKPGHDILTLRTRFHKHPIPVPRIQRAYGPLKNLALIRLLKAYGKQGKQTLVFVPTVGLAADLYQWLRLFVRGGNYVSSKKEDRERVIQEFKDRRYLYLVTTAVLERGVTVRNLQVIVYGADDRIYDAASLIQIAGRAGRKADAPTGDVIFLADHDTKGMLGAIEEIRYCNTFLQKVWEPNRAK